MGFKGQRNCFSSAAAHTQKDGKIRREGGREGKREVENGMTRQKKEEEQTEKKRER